MRPAGWPKTETTVAQVIKPAGYGTMCIGKWHLGRQNEFPPASCGFDACHGIPSSHDKDPSILLRGKETIESPVAIRSLTLRFTEQAVRFIERSRDNPFFLYLPYSTPHIPLAASAAFAGKSLQWGVRRSGSGIFGRWRGVEGFAGERG